MHRKHHRYADQTQDPHGPKRSLWHNLTLSLYNYELKYAGKLLLNDNLYAFQLKYYWWCIGLAMGIFALTAGIEFWLIIVGWVFLFQIALNLLGHQQGGTVNSHLGSIVLAGELYHRQHHDNPNLARFGLLDWPYHGVIRWLGACGKNVSEPAPSPH
jgi:fatty-acid desaturase